MAAGLLGAASLGPGAAGAAGPAINSGVRIDQLQPASPESAFFRSEGPHNPAAEGVEFAAAVTLDYGKDVLRDNLFDVNGTHTSTPLVASALLARVAGSVSPLHWLAFDLSLPFALLETGSTPPTVGGIQPAAGKGPGVGDLRVGVHFRPLDTTRLGVIVGGRVWAPFGSQAAYLSDSTFRAELDVGVAGEVNRALYGCTLDVAPGFFARRSGDRLAGACAGYFKLNDLVAIGVEPTFEVVTHPLFELDGGAASNTFGVVFEPLLGVRLHLGGVRVGLALGPGIGAGMGTAQVRGLLDVAYVGLGKPPKPPPAPPADRDLDGILDDVDACPDEAGPPSEDPKLNGCPLHDRDGDGIRDEEDFCPDRPGIPYPDPKANGCPDSDNDGLPDPIDECVNEPGPPPTGCPKYARLATGGFKVEPPIDFAGGDKLRPEPRAALEEVAATLRANPKIERVTIVVGTKGVKPPLSEKRVQEILLVLRAGNLDPSRYEVTLQNDLRAGLVHVKIAK